MSTQSPLGAERLSVSLEAPNRESTSDRPAKVRRIRLACLRCQTRKIKCDGSVPKCSNCHRAGTECVDGKTTVHEGAISRSEATSLYDKINKLEQVLRSRCPDIDVNDVFNSQNIDDLTQKFQTDDNYDASSTLHQPTIDLDDATIGPTNPANPNDTTTQPNPDSVAHEIGLIPLTAGVNKYVGPSSGFTFAKLLFARAGQASLNTTSPDTNTDTSPSTNYESPSTTRSRAAFNILPTPLPATVEQALQLSKIYFEHVHIQYPFLHEPSHTRLIHDVYRNGADAPKVSWFQVTMVLAVSATILSKRLRIPFTGEGLCAAAMEYVGSGSVDFQNSTQGVQCLLLIAMFTLHSPFLGVNPWYLSYQCLAAVLDLGLQRDVPVSRNLSRFEREMRTRMFWVIYSLDRTLATTLGRPIGLRDEACDLRLPAGTEDIDLESNLDPTTDLGAGTQSHGPLACSMILFRLARLNSEIKYILHSLTHNTPKYTYPHIPDLAAWQNDLWQRLQDVHDSIPVFSLDDKHMSTICQIRYHEIVMLLFRPTPRIRSPSKPSLHHCHQSAQTAIRLWKDLYETDRMSYSWITIHSVCLSAMTLLYCIWMVVDIAAATRIDVLTTVMRDASNLLSAAGEHWTEARRSRNSLDGLTGATVRWLIDTHSSHRIQEQPRAQTRSRAAPRQQITASEGPECTANQQQIVGQTTDQNAGLFDDMNFPAIDSYINFEDLALFVGAPDPFTNNFSDTMEGMFSEYQPLFDFNPAGDISMAFLGL